MRKPDMPCAECGKLLWRGAASKPGITRCRECHVASPTKTSPCLGCGVKCWGDRCRACYAKHQTIRAEDDHRTVRRQRERSAPGMNPRARDALLDRWKRQGKACAYCPAAADTIDHVVPLVRGGTNYEGNLVPCCKPCNSSKGWRTVVEWRTGKRLPRMRRAVTWASKAKPIKAIKGEQAALLADCHECGAMFTPRRRGIKYCGKLCMVSANRRLNRTRYRVEAGIDPESPYHGGTPGTIRVSGRRAA